MKKKNHGNDIPVGYSYIDIASSCQLMLTRFGRHVALSGTEEHAVALLLLELEKDGGTEK